MVFCVDVKVHTILTLTASKFITSVEAILFSIAPFFFWNTLPTANTFELRNCADYIWNERCRGRKGENVANNNVDIRRENILTSFSKFLKRNIKLTSLRAQSHSSSSSPLLQSAKASQTAILKMHSPFGHLYSSSVHSSVVGSGSWSFK